jgi:hypothetical protein
MNYLIAALPLILIAAIIYWLNRPRKPVCDPLDKEGDSWIQNW